MFIQNIHSNLTGLMTDLGDIGVFLAMFLESSIVPIPSEVIIIGAGAVGIPLASIIIFGALGSTLGGICGYLLGRYAAMPIILKFGKFILIKPHHIAKAEAFVKRYGTMSVFIGRILPIVPFKVFSIAAGITRVAFIPFATATLVGVLPRIYILALFGSVILRYKKPMLLVLLFAVFIVLALKITHKIYNGTKHQKKQ